MTAWPRRWLGGTPRDEVAAVGSGRWVVVDTETTGLDPERSRLIAIGGVAVDDDGIMLDDSFEIVLRSDVPGEAANIVIHGIGQEAQAAGMPARSALEQFRAWAADAPRVAFHADFDRRVLRNAFLRSGVPDASAPWLDLAPLAAALAPGAQRRGAKSLDDWLETFGIECSIRHNAGADALATAELLLRLRVVAASQGRIGFSALTRTARQGKWLGTAR